LEASHFGVAVLGDLVNRKLQFGVALLAGGALLIGNDIDVGPTAAALLDDQLTGLHEASAQLTHPLRGHLQAVRQAVHGQLESLPVCMLVWMAMYSSRW
jgi:hypothetical protein